MSYGKQVFGRRNRKLPYVPRAKKHHLFWPTYRGAVEWMRKNQHVLDTAFELLEIYPNIISDYSLDVFWSFIKPYVENSDPEYCQNKTGPSHTRITPSQKSKSKVKLPKVRPHVPLISITHDSDTDEEEKEIMFNVDKNHSRIPKVYVSGDFDHGTNGHSLTSTLIRQLSLTSYVSQATEKKYFDSVLESDSFVFILSDTSLNDYDSCERLCKAWSYDISPVFVREKDYKLPSPLPEAFLKQTLKSDDFLLMSKNCSFHRRSITPSDNRGLSQKHSCPTPRPDSATRHPKSTENPESSFKSSGLVLNLINGYHDSIIYDLGDPLASIRKLTYSLEIEKSKTPTTSKCSRNESRPRPTDILTTNNFLSVPSSVSPSLKSDSSISNISLTLPPTSPTEHLVVPIIEPDSDSGVHSPIEKETFYLVYPDPKCAEKQGGSPKVVRWPIDDGETEETNISSPDPLLDSSINFDEIDLGANIDYDIFSPDSSLGVDYEKW